MGIRRLIGSMSLMGGFMKFWLRMGTWGWGSCEGGREAGTGFGDVLGSGSRSYLVVGGMYLG